MKLTSVTEPFRTLSTMTIAGALTLTSCSVGPEGYQPCGPPSGTYRVTLEDPESPSSSCEDAVTQDLRRSHDLYLTGDDIPCSDNLSVYVQVETISVENHGECDVFPWSSTDK